MRTRQRQGMVAAAALAILVLALLVVTRDDGRPSSSLTGESASGAGVAEQDTAPSSTMAPGPSTTMVPSTVSSTTVATTTTATPIRTATTVATPEETTPASAVGVPRLPPTPAPKTFTGAMNGIIMQLRVEPSSPLPVRQGVTFLVDMSASTPGCCRASLSFSDGGTAGVSPRMDCPSATTAASGSAIHFFRTAGAYTTTLVATQCPAVTSPLGAEPQVRTVTTELVVCLRIVLDGSAESTSSAGPC